MVGCLSVKTMSVSCSTDDGHVTSIDLLGGDKLYDATWTRRTRRGHIVCTMYNRFTCSQSKLVVMSPSGGVIAQTQINLANP